jgi:hypothetical protein
MHTSTFLVAFGHLADRQGEALYYYRGPERGKTSTKKEKIIDRRGCVFGVNSDLASQLALGLLAPSTYLEAIQMGKSKEESWNQYIFSWSRTRQ